MERKIKESKHKYNHWLKRRLNAEKFFDENPEKVNYKHLEEFKKITIVISLFPKKFFKKTGIEMTEEEILEGFREV